MPHDHPKPPPSLIRCGDGVFRRPFVRSRNGIYRNNPTPQDYCNLVARHDLADDSDESKGVHPLTMAVLTFLVGLFWGACGMLIYVKFF